MAIERESSSEKKLLLIIPAYNEEAVIEKVISSLIMEYPQYDYVVINDGSTDQTGEICEENGFNVVNLPINLGIGTQRKTAMKSQYRSTETGSMMSLM